MSSVSVQSGSAVDRIACLESDFHIVGLTTELVERY